MSLLKLVFGQKIFKWVVLVYGSKSGDKNFLGSKGGISFGLKFHRGCQKNLIRIELVVVSIAIEE